MIVVLALPRQFTIVLISSDALCFHQLLSSRDVDEVTFLTWFAKKSQRELLVLKPLECHHLVLCSGVEQIQLQFIILRVFHLFHLLAWLLHSADSSHIIVATCGEETSA